MKSLLSVFVFALLARADSLPVVTILTASANQRCGNIYSACAPLEFDIPQLNGNVSSVTFALTDQEGVLFRYYASHSENPSHSNALCQERSCRFGRRNVRS
jgi:hypothetical protein